MKIQMAAALAVAAVAIIAAAPGDDAPQFSPNDWLLSVPDPDDRARLLQKQLRGFDQPMLEVGERYRSFKEALGRGNYDLAAYQWRKIRITIENGIEKRPGRAENARQVFLDATWDEVRTGVESRNLAKASAAYELANSSCQACHVAEQVDYVNAQALFETPPFK